MHQLAKSGDLMSCGSKDIFKNAPGLMYQYSSSKLEYLENGTYLFYERKKFLTRTSDDSF